MHVPANTEVLRWWRFRKRNGSLRSE